MCTYSVPALTWNSLLLKLIFPIKNLIFNEKFTLLTNWVANNCDDVIMIVVFYLCNVIFNI